MIHIFIVNPYAGDCTFANGLRKKLSKIEGLNYFVFNTRYPGYEREVVSVIQNIFDNEKLRFYCCGGSGTMRNMLCGFESFDDVEVAFFPCGLTNDYLKMFGDYQAKFYDINELIDGQVIKVDYLKTNSGVALNGISIGFDVNSVKFTERFRNFSIFGRSIPYSLSILYSIIITKQSSYYIETDEGKYEGGISELFLGNGNILGGNLHFFDDNNVDDGKASLRFFDSRFGIVLISLFLKLINKNFEDINRKSVLCKSNKFLIRRVDGKKLSVNQDGELESDLSYCEVEVVHKGLNLVVPKGVRL